MLWCLFFFFKQKTAYEMRISDWSSDVCSSDLSGRSLGIEKSSGSLAALLRFVISLSFRSAPSGGLEGCGGILAIEVRPARRLVHRVLGHVVAVLLVREDQVREAVEDQDVAERIDSEDSMADAADAVHQDDDAQLVVGVAEVAQHEELGDGVRS